MNERMKIMARAPARIDLAGGTVDIWPLYLFHDNAMTVNVAIDTFATVQIAERMDEKVIINSRDRHIRFRTDLRFEGLERNPVEFIARIVKFYEPESGLDVVTDCAAPAGAGLGGSSALAVVLSCALNLLLQRKYSKEYQVSILHNIESRILGVPTGVQDYYPALYGGLNALSYGYSGTSIEKLPFNLKKLQTRLVLCYTGKERQSGVSNWDMVKRYLDGNRRVRKAMGKICNATERVRDGFKKGDLAAVGEAMRSEWENRKKLSPKVTNAKIERLMTAAQRAGAIAGKVCGAGGGGCIVFAVKEGKKSAVERALANAGSTILDFTISRNGFSILS